MISSIPQLSEPNKYPNLSVPKSIVGRFKSGPRRRQAARENNVVMVELMDSMVLPMLFHLFSGFS